MFLQEKSLSLSVRLSAGLRARLSTRCSLGQHQHSSTRAEQELLKELSKLNFRVEKTRFVAFCVHYLQTTPQPPTAAHDWVRDKGMKT